MLSSVNLNGDQNTLKTSIDSTARLISQTALRLLKSNIELSIKLITKAVLLLEELII